MQVKFMVKFTQAWAFLNATEITDTRDQTRAPTCAERSVQE